MMTLVLGSVLAVAALGFVLYPIFFGGSGAKASPTLGTGAQPPAASTDQEIDAQIEAAVRAYREQKHDRCAACGTPVGARDARYCPNCGKRLRA